jgi:iron(III) transport system ATP-binding protein
MTTPQQPSAIHCHGLVKRFGAEVALDGFELEVPPGTILGLLGPSGCGKTTALRVIAGFERPDAGTVSIGGRTVVGDGSWVPPERRRIGMVFQDHALFPHMTVAANLAYGLQPPVPGRVGEVLDLVGLTGLEHRMPHELSGGEQQRVALGRALAPDPAVILLDEPFSSLDATLRERMRRDVRRILGEAGTAAVFVTHDQEEALSMADVVAVMRRGRVLQVGTPSTLYRHPSSPWVAGFVGESELIDGRAEIGKVTTPLGVFPQFGPLRGDVLVMIRPEWIHPVPAADGAAVVADREFYGHDQLLVLEFADGRTVTSRIGNSPRLEIGDTVDIGVDEVVLFER